MATPESAVKRFFRKLLKGQGSVPRRLVTDKLRSYPPALRSGRPVVAAVDVELEVYDLLEHVDRLRQRARAQAAIIGLLHSSGPPDVVRSRPRSPGRLLNTSSPSMKTTWGSTR